MEIAGARTRLLSSPMQTPEFPAVSAYPTEGHADEVSAAKALFEAELASDEGWEDMGEREGVQLFRKLDPEDAYAVPLVKVRPPAGHPPNAPLTRAG